MIDTQPGKGLKLIRRELEDSLRLLKAYPGD